MMDGALMLLAWAAGCVLWVLAIEFKLRRKIMACFRANAVRVSSSGEGDRAENVEADFTALRNQNLTCLAMSVFEKKFGEAKYHDVKVREIRCQEVRL